MLTSVTGLYRNGQITLTEQPSNLPAEAHVIVTFLATPVIDLAARGIDHAQAADLRARLQTFAAAWDNPALDIYNDYDSAKAALLPRRCHLGRLSQLRFTDGEVAPCIDCSGG